MPIDKMQQWREMGGLNSMAMPPKRGGTGIAQSIRDWLQPDPNSVYGNILPVASSTQYRNPTTLDAQGRAIHGAEEAYTSRRPAMPNMVREVLGDLVNYADAPRAALAGEMDVRNPENAEMLARGMFEAGGIGMATMKAPAGSLRSGAIRTAKELSPAETKAQEVLDLLKGGNAASVTDEMLAAADDKFLFDNYDLPMDVKARMGRAKDMGFGDDMYHGSTHVFDDFSGGSTKSQEGHFGAGNYLTSSADDASQNYAGQGPDLTSRITKRAEQIADEMDAPYDDPASFEIARRELSGDAEGVMYPVRARGENVYDVTPEGRTQLDYEQPRGDPEDFLDEAGGDMDLAEELATEDSYNFEPEGSLVDFIDNLKWNPDVDDNEGILGAINELGYEGGTSARNLDETMRTTEWYANNAAGDMSNNDVYRQAIEAAGFDKIRHEGDIFQGMNINPGTLHEIISKPENIRSQFARFDPRLSHLSNLSASGMNPAASVIGAMSPTEQIKEYLKGIRKAPKHGGGR